ncbi:MAG: hypothetical protein A2832_02020 [Candidatus Zambryskibacteria bacterium RIFCSPHIGHO2_01_FULL_44_22b]|uniref:DUF1902 domain-containing protein n=2 Tax=Candidatus Zambryskiibacteriota TaxID=1817925 RepID=A0A1G2SY14_9BACT|nr:MAG: hypothetical protein A2832_02020 [Candidatus Zambryskibacteria bacterium RIFCSPHIGHO2_01_FULL_44_22b]OHB05287.1 MAG: hypothetical protein A3B16_02700 [Candidatus Zambryskibacteria bacterium RIFCSPLOWO2_01_FULL_45_43]
MSKKTLTIKTQYGSFDCIFEPEKDMGGYVAVARKVQGAVTWGKNLAEAKRMAKEVIEGVIEAGIISRAEEQGIVHIRKNTHLVA